MIFKIAVVEDDKKQQDLNISLLKQYSKDYDISFNYSSFNNAFDFLENYRSGLYDVIFMDINMPGMNGMDCCKEIRKVDSDVIIIFVTDFAQFAIRGYEVDAFDFIVKPISYEHLCLKFSRLIPLLKRKYDVQRITFKNGNQLFTLGVDEIKYVEVKSHDTIIHAEDKDYCVRIPLSTIEAQLPKHQFSRCNHCYIVNLKYVGEVDKLQVRMVTGEELMISHPKRKAFLSSLMDFLGESL